VYDGAVKWRDALSQAMADRSVQNVHALRIQMKRLRYRVELARDLGAEEAVALIKWFKSLQDRLGRWHDRQEMGRFITRALASSQVLMGEPRVAVELLKEVEKDIAVSAREVETFFKMASESEGRTLLDAWLKSYCEPAILSRDAQHAEAAPVELARDSNSEQPAPEASQEAGEIDR
jgi:hypothetical protein